MEKYKTFRINISSVSYFKMFYPRKRKAYDTNDLLTLSLVSIIVGVWTIAPKENFPPIEVRVRVGLGFGGNCPRT